MLVLVLVLAYLISVVLIANVCFLPNVIRNTKYEMPKSCALWKELLPHALSERSTVSFVLNIGTTIAPSVHA